MHHMAAGWWNQPEHGGHVSPNAVFQFVYFAHDFTMDKNATRSLALCSAASLSPALLQSADAYAASAWARRDKAALIGHLGHLTYRRTALVAGSQLAFRADQF